ncbi:MAG: GNAT family N-acetyltransferase [Burkholderiales bacterium]|nr:GNAT family N-acetyltransferase [Burkholderiales bacterium]
MAAHRTDIHIERPGSEDWGRIVDILRHANFHHIGGPEMPAFPLADCFVAVVDGRIVGVAGYRILDPSTAKTTLLAVAPECRSRGIGEALQRERMDHLRGLGIKTLHTNTDDPRVVDWYLRHFGYRVTGNTTPKVAPFGRADRDHWIGLVVDL